MEISPRTSKKTAFIVVTVLILCVILIAYIFRTGISQALTDLKLVPEPETYTELYFNNASSLPTSIVPGRLVSFSFTIHNVEGTSTVYPYVAYFLYPTGVRTILASNTVSLADDASTTISIARAFNASEERGEVVVDLPSLNQQIDFLLPNNNE